MSARRPWPDEVRRRALELMAAGLTPSAVRRTLAAELGLTDTPAPGTLRGWRASASTTEKGEPVADPAAAAEARAASNAAERASLSDRLLRRLSSPSVDAIGLRLERSAEAEAVVDAAVERWRDAMVMRATASEFGPEAVREANVPVAKALAELEAAERLLIPVRDLVGILTRSVADHLALEGVFTEELDRAPLNVTLTLPERIVGEPVLELDPEVRP